MPPATPSLNILFTGPLTSGSISQARVEALRTLGHRVSLLDQRPYFRSSPWQKIQARLLMGPSLVRYERDLIEATQQAQPDLLFIDCALYLSPAGVRALSAPGRQVVQYSSDYFGYNAHIYRKLRKSAPYYDAHVITNSLNRGYLEKWGAQRSVMTRFGYDPTLHFPVEPTSQQRARFTSDVAFGGHREPFYENMLRALKSAGFSLRVSGSAWTSADFLESHEKIGQTSPEEYRAMVCSARVAPAFLSKWNRNTSGMRTFEVAAMGVPLIAERTEEQVAYFREGIEAEFFSTADELVKKVRTLIDDDSRRQAMGAAGLRRCRESGYSYLDRMRTLIDDLVALRQAP